MTFPALISLLLMMPVLSSCSTVSVRAEHKVIYEGQEYYGCTLTIEGAF